MKNFTSFFTTAKNLLSNCNKLFVALLLLLCGMVNAQTVASYTFAQSSGTFTPVPTGGTRNTTVEADDATLSVALPFTFTYNGTGYSNVVISSNGFLVMGSTTPSNTSSNAYVSTSNNNGLAISTSTAANANTIAPFSFDNTVNSTYTFTGTTTSGSNTLTACSGANFTSTKVRVGMRAEGTNIPSNTYITAVNIAGTSATMSANATATGAGATITTGNGFVYVTQGTSPNRTFTIQWTGFKRFSLADDVDYQVILSETTNTIRFVYNFVTVATTGTAGTHDLGQIGIKGATNADFNNRTTTSNWSSTTAGGANTSTCTLSNTVKPAAGQTYTFTPPVTYTSIVANGVWNTAATWSVSTGGNAVPIAGSTVIINTNVNASATPTNQPLTITINNGFTLTLGAAYTNPSGSTITVASGGTLALGATLTNTGTTTVNGTVQINGGGYASGTAFSYAATGTTLIMNHNSGLYGISTGQAFWPTSNPPFNVTIQGTGAQINNTVGAVAGTLTVSSQLACAATPSVTVSGTAILTSQLSSSANGNFLSNGILQINSGGFASGNPPTYGAASSLVYNTGSTSGSPYGVGSEWTASAATAGIGIPNNVTIQGTTFITMPNSDRGMSGAFNVTVGSGITLNASTGNLSIGGNFTQNGTLTHNTRAINFFGTTATTQTITGTGLNSTGATNCFAYFLNNTTGTGGVTIGVNATIDAAAGDVLQLLNAGPLKIGAFTFTVNGNGGNILVSGASRIIDFTSASGILKIIGTTGTLKTVTTAASGLLSITSSVAGGQVQVQSGGFDCGASLTTFGTGSFLTLLSGSYVANNSPTYATGSTLSFRTGAGYGVGSGDKSWGIGTSGVGVPDKVEVNAASTNVSINEDRTARSSVTVTAGTLTNNTNILNIATTVTTGATALSVNGGALTNGGGTINIGVANGGNQALSLTSGSLTISSGTVNLNGNAVTSGGTFTMSNGNFNIDPNSGTLATSVGSGTTIWTTGGPTYAVTGGTITFVDPPNAGTALTLSNSVTPDQTWTGNTVIFGGSSGTNTTTATVGFKVDTYVGSGRLFLNNVTINGGNTTDRYTSGPATTGDDFNIGGTLLINSGSELRNISGGVISCSGDVTNNGTFTSIGLMRFAKSSSSAGITGQTVSGTGVWRNLTASSTASFTAVSTNNTSAAGIILGTLTNPLSISGAFTNTAGLIFLGNNDFTFITGATSFTGSVTQMFVTATATTGALKYIFATGVSSGTFPVGENTGTTEFSPFSISFSTNSVIRTVGVRVVDASHPNLNDVDTQTDFISRYWQLSNSAAGTYTYTGTATYLPADINGTETNMKMGLWNGASPWKQASSSAATNVLTISSGLTEITGPLSATAEFTGRVKGSSAYTWDGSTSSVWTDATNWTPDRNTPASNDVLTFNGSIVATPTVTAVPTETIGQLFLTNSANVTLQSAAAVTLTISGGTGTDLDIPSGSHLQLGSTAANSINLAFTGAQTASIAGQLSLLTNTSNNNTYTATNSVTTVTGTINSSGTIASTTANLLFTTGTYNHTFPATGVTANLPAIPTATWTANTSLCKVSGLTSPTAGTFPSGLTGQTFGNFTWDTPSLSTDPNIGGGTITSVGTFTMTSTGSAALRLGTGTSGTIIATNYTQTGGTINMASGAGLGTIRVSGTFNQSAGTITETSTGNGTLEFNGAVSQSVTPAGTISNDINVKVSNPSGIAITGTLPLNANTTFTAASSGTAVTSGTVTYNTTTTLAYVTAVGAQTTGNEFPATSGPVNVTFNNTNATPTVTLSGSRTVTGTLTLTAGRVTLGANDLTLSGTTLTATSPSTTNMIVINGAGLFKRSISTTVPTAYLYPIGEITGIVQYSPVTLQFTANSAIRIVGAKVIDGISGNMNTPSTPTNYLSRYWIFSENGAGGTYNYYINPAVAITGAEDEVGTASLIKAAYWNGSVWTASANTYTTGSLVSNATGVSETAAPLGTVEWTGRDNPPVTYTWVGFTDTSWNTATNWSPSGIPGSSDTVTLANGSTGALANLSLTTAVSVSNLTFNGTGSFFAVGASPAAIAVSGNVTYTGGTGTWNATSTFTISSASSQTIPAFSYGNLTTSGGARVWTTGTTGIAGTFTPGAGAYTATSGSTVDFNGAGSQTIGAVNYANLTISGARGTATITLASGTIDVSGSYTVSASGTLSVVTTGNTVNFSSASSQTIPAFVYNIITNSGNGPRTLASSGSIQIVGTTFTPGSGVYTVTGSTIDFSNATGFTIPALTPAATNNYNNLTISGAGTYPLGASLTLGGNFSQTAGTVTVTSGSTANTMTVSGTFTQSAGTFNVTGSAATAGATVTVTGATSVFSVIMSPNSANATSLLLPTPTNTILFQANGNATYTGTSTTASLNWMSGGTSGLTYNITFGIKGNFNWTGSGKPYTSGSGSAKGFTFNGTGTLVAPQTLTYAGATADYGHIFVVNTGTVVKLLSNIAIGPNTNPSNSFTVNGTLDASTFTVNGGATNGTFTLASGATLRSANTNGVVSTTVGSVSTSINTRTFDPAANYEFNGTAAQTTNIPNTPVNNLTINNNIADVKINQSTTVNGNLTFTAGNLDLNGSFNITLGTAGNIVTETNTARLINTSSPSATNGYVGTTRTLGANPGNVGNIGMDISVASAMGSTVIKRFPKVVSAIPTALNSISRVYSILPATASTPSTIALNYFDGELNGNTETAPSLVTFNSTGADETVAANYSYIGATATNSTANTVTYNAANLSTTNTFWTCLNSVKYITNADGNWHTGATWIGGVVPPANADVIINHIVTVGADSATVNSLIINATKSLTVFSGFDLNVRDAVLNNGTLTLQNNANLIQINNVANSGTGSTVVARNSSALKRFDYTLWSSPVAGQGLYAFSPFTFGNRFYVYRPNTNLYNNPDVGFSITGLNPDGVNGTDSNNVQFASAKGYLIRMPWNHPTAATIWNGSFSGTIPNNGDIPFTMISGASGFRFNLVGNPYPSPMSMSQFVSDNSANITGTLYFWRETNATTANNAYCSWAGGTFTTNSEAQVFNPNGIIRTGQGFIVEGTGAGTALAFKNGQRSSDNTNQFFRTTNEVETNRFWLNLTNTAGAFSQMAAGYMTDATNGVDLYDGKNINDGNVLLNSILDNTDYTIQGKALPFNAADVIPLSCKITDAGEYTITIDHVDGLFLGGTQPIVIKDNLTSTYHDLQTGAYTFTSDAGVFNARFEILYQMPLHVDNPTFNANQVVIYKNDVNDFVINSGNVMMASVKIFDIRGRLLVESKRINASQTIMNVASTNEVLLVQITSVDGVVVTKKVVR